MAAFSLDLFRYPAGFIKVRVLDVDYIYILKTPVVNFDVQLSIKSIKNSLFTDGAGDFVVWERLVVSEEKVLPNERSG